MLQSKKLRTCENRSHRSIQQFSSPHLGLLLNTLNSKAVISTVQNQAALQPGMKYFSELHWSRKQEWQAECTGTNFKVSSMVMIKFAMLVQKMENQGFGPACKCVVTSQGTNPQLLQQILRVKMCLSTLWAGTNDCSFKSHKVAKVQWPNQQLKR